MVRSLGFVLAVLCAGAVVAAQAPAQEPPTQYPTTQQPAGQPAQKPPAPPAPPTQTAQVNKVSYTGCLKPGATAESWTLENAEMASAAGAPAKSGEGAVGTSGAAGSKMIFNLSAKPTENLKPHANHKIEVVGTVSKAGASRAASGAEPGAAGTPPRQTLNVESFKMVSATCP